MDIGAQGSNINPLQILFDNQSMGTSPYAYAKAYDMHKNLLVKFFQVWFDDFSPNMESYLDETLNEVYREAKIYRDRPESWNNPFPVLKNLRNIWEKDMGNKDLGAKHKTAEALVNKTYHISEEGSLNYMNKPTTDLDLSKDFIIIDLSGVPEIIQEPMNVLVTGIIASRFFTDNNKETIIAVDEAAVYLRNPELASSMLKTLTQGRSHKIFLWLATHQPSDFAKNKVKEEYKTNMFINIVLGANLENAIGSVKDYFDLTQEECDILTSAAVGEGLLLVNKQRIPIRFEPTELEKAVIKGQYKAENSPENPPIACGIGEYSIRPEYQWLVDKQRIILTDWIIGDPKLLENHGYEKHRISRVGESGTRMAYFPNGYVENKLVDIPGIGKMTVDHYCSVIQLAALGQEYNADEILINHNAEVDLQLKFGYIKVGLEVEEGGSHTIDQLVKKKGDALGKYNFVKFICSSTDSKKIISAVGEDHVLQKGSSVRDFMQTLAANPQIHQNMVNSGEFIQIGTSY